MKSILTTILILICFTAFGQNKNKHKHYYYYISAITKGGITLSSMADITHEATEEICKVVITENMTICDTSTIYILSVSVATKSMHDNWKKKQKITYINSK